MGTSYVPGILFMSNILSYSQTGSIRKTSWLIERSVRVAKSTLSVWLWRASLTVSANICWADLILSWWPHPSSCSTIPEKGRQEKQRGLNKKHRQGDVPAATSWWRIASIPNLPALLLEKWSIFCCMFVLHLVRQAPGPLLLFSTIHKSKLEANGTLSWISLLFYSRNACLHLLPICTTELCCSLTTFTFLGVLDKSSTLQMLVSFNHKARGFVQTSQYSQATMLSRIFKSCHNVMFLAVITTNEL